MFNRPIYLNRTRPGYNDLMKRQPDKKPSKFAVELKKAKREINKTMKD